MQCVCGKRVSVNSIHCAHVATGFMDNVWECEEVWRECHKVLCAKCVEEDMKKRRVFATGCKDREGWRRRMVIGLANPCYQRKFVRIING